MTRSAQQILPADGEAFLYPSFLSASVADALLATLKAAVSWQQETATLFGRSVALPRLTAWYGDAGYRYSGVVHDPEPWPDWAHEHRPAVEAAAGAVFNSVLLNRYRAGSDGIGWHSDAEPSLGRNPVIASLSLGAVRRFRLKHRRGGFAPIGIDLDHGSLLVMAGACQHHWLHCVPKTTRDVEERINLTFRRVVTDPLADDRAAGSR